ncbi:hypothetical protein [Nocardia sp. A7]|uniref:hypothetical protein n=1 Tax=Nocardia sp. A7 TaxID=2789274 RepID=UPI00397BF4BC
MEFKALFNMVQASCFDCVERIRGLPMESYIPTKCYSQVLDAYIENRWRHAVQWVSKAARGVIVFEGTISNRAVVGPLRFRGCVMVARPRGLPVATQIGHRRTR